MWRFFAGRTTVQILEQIQKMLAEENVRPSQFKGGIIFMSMHNDTDWGLKHKTYVKKARRVLHPTPITWNQVDGHSSALADEEKRYGSLVHKPEGRWNSTAKVIYKNSLKVDILCSGVQLHFQMVCSKVRRWKTFHALHRGPELSINTVEDDCCR